MPQLWKMAEAFAVCALFMAVGPALMVLNKEILDTVRRFCFGIATLFPLIIYDVEGWIPVSHSGFVAWTCAGYRYGIHSSFYWKFGT